MRRWLSGFSLILGAEGIDDLVQEAYAKLWTSDCSQVGDGRRSFHALVRDALSDRLRRAGVIGIESATQRETLEGEDLQGPEPVMSAPQQFEQLVGVVETLPPQQRTVYRLRKFEGLSLRLISQQMDITETTVEDLLRLAEGQVIRALFAEGKLIDCSSRGAL